VLRGPQSTLFGRNTTGGAVNYISKRPAPGDGLNGYLRATYGSYNQADGEGAVGFDISRTVAARLAFQVQTRDGLFNNLATGDDEFGDREKYSGRLQLAWEPSERTRVLYNFSAGFNRGETLGNKANGILDPEAFPTPTPCPELAKAGSDFQSRNSCVNRRGFNPSTDRWQDIWNPSSARQDIDLFSTFLKLEHDLDWATFTSIIAYQETTVDLGDDNGGAPTLEFLPQQDSEFDQITVEARFASPSDQRFRWLAGFYWFHEDALQGTLVRRFTGMDITAFNILDQEDRDFSYYGQFEYDLRPDLTLTAGLRFTDNNKEAVSQFGVAATGAAGIPIDTFTTIETMRELTADTALGSCPPPPVPCLLETLLPQQSVDAFGFNLALNYRFSDNLMFYGSASRGFKTGGFDTRALAGFFGSADAPVEEEFLLAYEFGFKSDWLDNRLQLNATGFVYDWEDLQTFAVIGIIPGFFNIPETSLYGAETEFKWMPAAGWLIQGSAGWLETEIEDDGGLDGVDTGHELPNSPQFSFNGIIQREIPLQLLGQNGVLNLQVDFRWVDKQKDTLQFEEDFVATKDEQFYLNFRSTYAFGMDNRYEVAFWAENLTEERHCMDLGVLDNVLNPGPLVAGGAGLTFNVSCQPTDGQRLLGGTFKWSF